MCIGALITPFVKKYLALETLLYLTFFYLAYIPLNTYIPVFSCAFIILIKEI